MGIKVVEVTQVELTSGELVTRRAQEVLGFRHPDSVRQAALAGKIRRVERGVYDLASVLEYRDRRESGMEPDPESGSSARPSDAEAA